MKNKQVELMKKLYKEYHDSVVELAVNGGHIKKIEKRHPGKRHDCMIVSQYYNVGTEHCGKRTFVDLVDPYSFEYLVFEHQGNGAFVRVFTGLQRKGNRFIKAYDFTILKDDKVFEKKLYNSDFDNMTEAERALIMMTENCYDIIARSEMAEYSGVNKSDE